MYTDFLQITFTMQILIQINPKIPGGACISSIFIKTSQKLEDELIVVKMKRTLG
jgi:hypothetical protein